MRCASTGYEPPAGRRSHKYQEPSDVLGGPPGGDERDRPMWVVYRNETCAAFFGGAVSLLTSAVSRLGRDHLAWTLPRVAM
jgi:hypothetical protein